MVSQEGLVINTCLLFRSDLLTQHKKTLLELFSLGATVEEVVTFLKENNFTSISEENLKEFLKKKK